MNSSLDLLRDVSPAFYNSCIEYARPMFVEGVGLLFESIFPLLIMNIIIIGYLLYFEDEKYGKLSYENNPRLKYAALIYMALCNIGIALVFRLSII